MISRFLTNSTPVFRRVLIFLLCLPLVFFSTSCAKRSRATPNASASPEKYASASQFTQRLNINTAPAKELEALPGIGRGLAERIVEHRQRYGPFRRPAHLMMVRGISETRFRALRDLITVE
jgi:competence ComEA-like helix-hairpin-helix protein